MIIMISVLFALLASVVVIYRKGRKDAYEDPPSGTVIKHDVHDFDVNINSSQLQKDIWEEEEMFMENDYLENSTPDEYSPENLDFVKTMKELKIRKSLEDIIY